MPKTSIIVPVYNVKEYLKKCVDSILAQTENDFELLLIDDGSTDESGTLCDTLAETDKRIRVIHQQNQGLGGARNTGIDAAQGDWLLLVDSDDWIEPETLEKALSTAKATSADMVVFDFRSVSMQGDTLQTFDSGLPKNTALSLTEHKDILLTSPCAWNKLYKAKLFKDSGIRYPSRVWYEDIRTTLKLMTAANSIAAADYVGYNYLQRPGSIMNNINLKRNTEIIEAFEDLLPYFRENGLFEEYRDELCYLTAYHEYFTASVRVLRAEKADKALARNKLLPSFKSFLTESFPNYRENKYLARLSKSQQLLWWLLEKKMYGCIVLLFKLKDRKA